MPCLRGLVPGILFAVRVVPRRRDYRDWAATLKRSMRQQHRAGEKLFADFAGQIVPILDAEGGLVFEASIFVAVLGASNYTYACATRGQTTADWIGGMVCAMEYAGGVPELLVPDNPRALVAHPDRYEPVLSRTAEDFVHHYGTVMLPARPPSRGFTLRQKRN